MILVKWDKRFVLYFFCLFKLWIINKKEAERAHKELETGKDEMECSGNYDKLKEWKEYDEWKY